MVKRRLIWAQPALDQLDEIAAHIALDKPEAAAELVRKCIDATERLLAFPESGRYLPELKTKRYRELVVTPCRIIYRLEVKNILILQVLRGEQRLRSSKLQ